MKNRIKSFFTTNLGWKIASLVIGIMVWVFISNTQDPMVNRTINIPVVYENADVLLENDKLVVLNSPDTVTINVSVRESNLNRVTPSLFTCTADLTDHAGAELSSKRVHVNVTQISGSDIVVDWSYYRGDPNVVVSMDNFIEKQFKVQRLDEDVISEGLRMESYFEPETVTVSGPESHFASLQSVKAVVNLQELSKDGGGEFSKIVKLGLYDANGKAINDEMLKLSQSEVTMRAIVTRMATVPVKLEGVNGTPASGFKYLSYTVDPAEVLVYGLKSSIAALEEIRIPSSMVDVEGISENTEYKIDISSLIPDGISLADSNSIVTLTVMVEALEVKTVTIPAQQIHIIGMSEDKEYHISNAYIRLNVRGFKEDLQVLDESIIPISIDVTDLIAGTHTVPVNVGEISGYKYDNVDSLSVSVVIEDKKEETEDEPKDEEEDATKKETEESTSSVESTSAETSEKEPTSESENESEATNGDTEDPDA